jgi:hypothetical protein
MRLESRDAELPKQKTQGIREHVPELAFPAPSLVTSAIIDAQKDRFAARGRRLKPGYHFRGFPKVHARVVGTGGE